MRPDTGLKHAWGEWKFVAKTLTCCTLCGVVINDKIKDAANCPGVVKLRPADLLRRETLPSDVVQGDSTDD